MGGSVLGTGSKNQVKGSTTGTMSPAAQAAAAEHAASSVSTATTGSSSAINPALINRGYDPTTNQPTTGVIYKPIKGVPYSQAYINNMGPEERTAFQAKLLSIGAYPKGYTPVQGIVSTEDYNALAKLVNVGEQKNIGDINAVIDTVKKDPKLLAYVQTGGYAATGAKTYTTAAEAGSALTNSYLDLFNDKPTKQEIATYTSALNAKEKASKTALTQQEREDVLLSVTQNRVSNIANLATTGDATSISALDEGQIGKAVRAIRQAYSDNGIPVDNKTIYQLAGQAIRNQTAYDNVMQHINLNAKTQWGPVLGDVIDKGGSVKVGLTPYISLKSSITGIPQGDIKVSDMTDVLNPDGTLKKYAEYKTSLYNTDAYKASDNYKSTLADDTKALVAALRIG